MMEDKQRPADEAHHVPVVPFPDGSRHISSQQDLLRGTLYEKRKDHRDQLPFNPGVLICYSGKDASRECKPAYGKFARRKTDTQKR